MNGPQKTIQLDGQCNLIAASGGVAQLPKLHITAYNGGTMRPSGGWGDVIVDLSGVALPGSTGIIPILAHHDSTQIVGHAGVRIDATGIHATGVVSGTGKAAQEFLGSARNGFPWKASIGLSVDKSRVLKPGETLQLNGQEVSGPITIVERSLLGEISVLPWPADQSTDVQIAARKANSMEARDMSDKQLTAEQVRKEAVAETERIHQIKKICNGQYGEVERQAIAEGWSAERTELNILRADRELQSLRAERQQTPRFEATVSSGVVSSEDLLVAGMLCSAGMDEVASQQISPVAAERGSMMRHWTMMDFVRASLETSGQFRSTMSKSEMLKAAFSTTSFPIALGNATGKSVAAAYQNAPSAWRDVCDVRTAADFKDNYAVRLVGFDNLAEVGSAGEIKHTDGAEEYYSFSVDTFARMFSVTRQQLINDDAGLLESIGPALGRAAARSVSDKFAEVLLANTGSHFSSGNGNYISGAATNLQSSSLATAVQTLRTMTDTNGQG